MGFLLFVYLLVVILVIWLNWYIANQFYDAAKAKGYNNRKYLWICFWLGVVGYLLVNALPDRGSMTDLRNNIAVCYDELPDL